MYFSRYCVRKLTKKLEIKVLKAVKAYLKLVAKIFLLNAITCKQAAYEIYSTYIYTYISAVQCNTVRINIISKYSTFNYFLYFFFYIFYILHTVKIA